MNLSKNSSSLKLVFSVSFLLSSWLLRTLSRLLSIAFLVNFLVRFLGARSWRAGVSGDGTIRSSRSRLFEVRGVEGRGGIDVFKGGGGGSWFSDLTNGIRTRLVSCHRVLTSSSLDETCHEHARDVKWLRTVRRG